ncbi:uncharacterized protein LOC126235990 isoform X1 [Schistocerca nitens]|uniref:uncharacterized protein LOC126235990 isoform X1 n=1 Tax=Schistocerca nitens TaxID=7011 RepID=UPI002117ED09|nr:uncharacterized protein LOC126235990 isoform X1 [Schistocerca nitens]
MKTFAKYITALVISVVCVLDYCSCLQNNEVFNKSVEALLASEGEILVCAFIMGFLAFNYHNGLQNLHSSKHDVSSTTGRHSLREFHLYLTKLMPGQSCYISWGKRMHCL